MISIIIPTINQHEMTQQCLEAITGNTAGDYRIILVDNGSSPPFELGKIPNLTIIPNETNLGFPKAINQGLKVASGDYLCIANNDTIVAPGWDKLLIAHLDKYDVVAATGNNISGEQEVLAPTYETETEYYRVAAQIAEKNKGKSRPYHRLCMHYFTMKRAVYEKVGLLDEAFSPGNYEDDDYSFRAIAAGFKIAIAEDVYIHHFGSVTFKKEVDYSYIELLKRNREYFNAKWTEAEKQRLINIVKSWGI